MLDRVRALEPRARVGISVGGRVARVSRRWRRLARAGARRAGEPALGRVDGAAPARGPMRLLEEVLDAARPAVRLDRERAPRDRPAARRSGCTASLPPTPGCLPDARVHVDGVHRARRSRAAADGSSAARSALASRTRRLRAAFASTRSRGGSRTSRMPTSRMRAWRRRPSGWCGARGSASSASRASPSASGSRRSAAVSGGCGRSAARQSLAWGSPSRASRRCRCGCIWIRSGWRPTPLTDEELATYGDSAGGRRVTARLRHPPAPSRQRRRLRLELSGDRLRPRRPCEQRLLLAAARGGVARRPRSGADRRRDRIPHSGSARRGAYRPQRIAPVDRRRRRRDAGVDPGRASLAIRN